MACCNIAWGNVPPSVPPTILQFPIYLDRAHREVWYWNGNYWELVWQLPLASDTTGGVVKISPDSPITIDSDGYLQIDCARLTAHCNLLDKAALDAAIENFRIQFMSEITRIDRRIDAILTTIGTIIVRLTAIETTVGDFDRRISIIETSITDLTKRVSVIEGDIVTIKGAVTDLGTRVTRVEGDVVTIKGAVTDINTRITNITNGGNAAAADIAALKAKDIYLEDLIKNLNPRVDYAVEASGRATSALSGYTVTWTVFSSPNSNIKKFSGGVCVLPSAEVISTAGVESVEFAIPATTIISASTNIGSFISPSVPTATMGFDAFVANGNLGVKFKHVLGSLLGCHGHLICVEFI